MGDGDFKTLVPTAITSVKWNAGMLGQIILIILELGSLHRRMMACVLRSEATSAGAVFRYSMHKECAVYGQLAMTAESGHER